MYSRFHGWTSESGAAHADKLIKAAGKGVAHPDKKFKKDKSMRLFQVLHSCIEGVRNENKEVNRQSFDGVAEPSEEAGSAMLSAIARREKEVPKVRMLGEVEAKEKGKKDKKDKKKKKRKHPSSSDSSSSESESEATKKAAKDAKLLEKQKQDQEKKEKDDAARAAGEPVEDSLTLQSLQKSSSGLHKKKVEMKHVRGQVLASGMPRNHQKEMTTNLDAGLAMLNTALNEVENATTDAQLVASIEANERATMNANCELKFIKARLADNQKAKKDQEKKELEKLKKAKTEV